MIPLFIDIHFAPCCKAYPCKMNLFIAAVFWLVTMFDTNALVGTVLERWGFSFLSWPLYHGWWISLRAGRICILSSLYEVLFLYLPFRVRQILFHSQGIEKFYILDLDVSYFCNGSWIRQVVVENHGFCFFSVQFQGISFEGIVHQRQRAL